MLCNNAGWTHSIGHSQLLENCWVPRHIRETSNDVPGSVIISMLSALLSGPSRGPPRVARAAGRRRRRRARRAAAARACPRRPPAHRIAHTDPVTRTRGSWGNMHNEVKSVNI